MINLDAYKKVLVKQRFEIAEIFSFESRNKYDVTDETGNILAYAAENQKGVLGFLFRQMIGHWRTFEIHLFNPKRALLLIAKHPFRFFFQRLEVCTPEGVVMGVLQQRFAFFSKRFDLQDANGNVLMEVSSPIWKIWAFPFIKNGRELALVEKKWSGLLTEIATDKDNFLVTFSDPTLDNKIKMVVLMSAIFIDVQYFEHKASNRS